MNFKSYDGYKIPTFKVFKRYLRGHRGEVKQQPAVLRRRDDVEVVVVGEGDERPVVPGQAPGRQGILWEQQLADVATFISIAAATVALRF